MMGAPNCHECLHRRSIPGDCHSRCAHPSVPANDPLGEIASLLGKRMGPLPMPETTIRVEGHPHGIANGWFNWPYNYDPTWLVSCDGFAAREGGDPCLPT